VTRAAFIVRHPEFADATLTALVESKLAEASRRTPSTIWGDLEDDGVALLAAHLLCVSPYGVSARLSPQDKEGQTTYGRERDRLEDIVGGAYRVSL
jgi:hypothetical protein